MPNVRYCKSIPVDKTWCQYGSNIWLLRQTTPTDLFYKQQKINMTTPNHFHKTGKPLFARSIVFIYKRVLPDSVKKSIMIHRHKSTVSGYEPSALTWSHTANEKPAELLFPCKQPGAALLLSGGLGKASMQNCRGHRGWKGQQHSPAPWQRSLANTTQNHLAEVTCAHKPCLWQQGGNSR